MDVVLQPQQRHTDNCDAADMREQSAASTPIQRSAPSLSPTQIVNSADTRELPACHFGGFKTRYAKWDVLISDKKVKARLYRGVIIVFHFLIRGMFL